MKELKAIVIGCVFIIVTILVLQLVFIFVAVAYNALAHDYPFLHDITGIFRYLIGIPIFILTMFIGGYLTANIAAREDRTKILLLCMSVGFITSGVMIYPMLETSTITMTGIVIITLAILATAAGGLYWKKSVSAS